MEDNEIIRDYADSLISSLLRQTTMIMFILRGDGSIVRVNNAFKEMFGRQLQVEGLNIRELLTLESVNLLDAAGGRIIDGMKLIFSNDRQSSHMLVCRVVSRGENMLVFSEQIMATEAVVMKHMTVMNNELSNLTRELHRKNVALQQASEEIKVLKSLLPICSYCKKIRDTKGYWNQLESYITNHTNSEFSHGICDDCMAVHFPECQDETK